MKPPRVLPPVYLLVAVVAMIALNYLLPVRQIVPGWWRWLGAVPIVAGLGVVLWVATLFSRHKTTIKPGEVSTHLIAEGPFRFSRNPIYLSMILVLIGLAVVLGGLTPWFVIPLFVVVIMWNIIPVEEAMLAEVFGDEYAQYRARVRRWI
jgi:protein-S-isoprenylcysteine O-methyltransferase Ste14